MNLNPLVSNKPMWVVILSWFLIVWGISWIAGFVFMILFTGTFALSYVLEMLLPGLVLFYLGKKLKNKKWQ